MGVTRLGAERLRGACLITPRRGRRGDGIRRDVFQRTRSTLRMNASRIRATPECTAVRHVRVSRPLFSAVGTGEAFMATARRATHDEIDLVDQYLTDVERHTLLTKDDENRLSHLMQAGRRQT